MDQLKQHRSSIGFLAPVYREIDKLQAAVKSLRIRESPGVKPNITALGTDLRIARQAATSKTQIRQFKVKTVEDDYLVCRSWDDVTEGTEDEFIAKPFKLRRTPFDGITKTYVKTWPSPASSFTVSYAYHTAVDRSATTNLIVEEQTVIPRYSLDDIIYAVECEDDLGVQIDIVLIDLNMDGRAWAEVSSS